MKRKIYFILCIIAFSTINMLAEKATVTYTTGGTFDPAISTLSNTTLDTLIVTSVTATDYLTLADLRIIRTKFLTGKGNGTFTLNLSSAKFENNILPSPGSGTDGAFDQMATLKEVIFPEGLLQIGRVTFRYCRYLGKVNFPAGLEVIGANSFSQSASASNTALVLTELPNSVKTIDTYAFYGCNAVALTKLPDALTGTIGTYAFQNTAVAISVIPEGVTAIGGSAFNCGAVAARQKITSITFPSTLTTLASNAFTSQANITYVEFKSSTPPTPSAQLVAGTAFPAAVTRIIVPQGALSAYQAATTSFSGFTFEEKVPTAVDKISSINVGIYPNPVSDRLNVISAQGIKDIKIYNIAGRIVNVSQDVTNKSFDVSHLAKGIYFLNVDGKVARFIKE